MARPRNTKKGKELLKNLGVKIDPMMKKAIEGESAALGITPGTYARQLLITGWQSRHNAPIAKNPRESILLNWFNELPIGEQENILAMVEALHRRHGETRLVTGAEWEKEEGPIPDILGKGHSSED